MTREQRLSPEQFSVLQRELLRLESNGHGPEACVVGACEAAGIDPPTYYVGVKLVVDPHLSESPTGAQF